MKRGQSHIEINRSFVNFHGLHFLSKQQQEIDYVEESDGKIAGYEFKWNPKAKVKIPENFVRTYKAEVEIISKTNFREFVMK